MPILDFNFWLKEQESPSSYCDAEILKLSNHFEALLQLNQCVVISIPNEWDVLKAYVLSMLTSIDSIDYLQTWSKRFKNKDVMSSCSNILHIIELLITPFSNAKLKRMFSQINRVKTDFRNRLDQKRLGTLLRIGEEGPEIKDFDPDCYINMWYQDKVQRVSAAKPHNYLKKENLRQPQMAL